MSVLLPCCFMLSVRPVAEQDDRDATPLHIAFQQGFHIAAQLLLSYGAHANAWDHVCVCVCVSVSERVCVCASEPLCGCTPSLALYSRYITCPFVCFGSWGVLPSCMHAEQGNCSAHDC